jgi:DNA relaxase NicK
VLPVGANSSRAAAAAGNDTAAARAEKAPTGNTGINVERTNGIRVKATQEQLDKEARYKFFAKEVLNYPKNGLVLVDWLTLTFREKDIDLHTVIIGNLYDMLEESGISVIARSRGLYNYDNSAQLKIISDQGVDISVGNLAHSERQGIMLELSGAGCAAMLSLMPDLYVFAQVHAARITRLDLALDLSSDYCVNTGFTVPKQGMIAQEGGYSAQLGCKKQSISTVGAWNDLLFGGVSCDDYDPLIHASGGLTLYVGSNTSANQIVM